MSSPVPPVRSTKVFIAVTQQLQRTCPLDVHLFSFRKSVKDPSTHVSRCFCLSFLPLKNCFLRCPHAADREMCLHFLLFLASHFSLFSPMPFTERVGSILATDFFVGVACRQRFGNKKKNTFSSSLLRSARAEKVRARRHLKVFCSFLLLVLSAALEKRLKLFVFFL